MIIIAIMLIPLIAAALVCLPFKKSWAQGVTVVSSTVLLALTLWVARIVSAGHFAISASQGGIFKWIAVDSLSALMLMLVALVSTTASIYSIGYLAHDGIQPRELRLYYTNYNLFIFSMLAILVFAQPTLVWIMVELTTVCSVLLVSFKNTREALEAAWKYVILSLMGAGMALFGFLVLFAAMQASGSGQAFTWQGLVAAAPSMPSVLLKTSFLLILIGLGTKVGLVPMHTWLPDAHSQAPSPVCALLSGIETTTILYVILRLFPVMHAASDNYADTWAVVFGLISVGVAAFLLLQVNDYKRMFAFSTVEHMGIILVALGFGSSAAGYGMMQQIVSHCVTKSFCFFAAGSVLLATGTTRISAVRDLIKRSPAASAALIFGGLAISGAPPMAVFLSEFLILKSGLTQKCYVAVALLAVFIVIAFFGIMFHINRMVFGTRKPKGNEFIQQGYDEQDNEKNFRLPLSCQLALILSAVPALVFGLYIPKSLQDLFMQAAAILIK